MSFCGRAHGVSADFTCLRRVAFPPLLHGGCPLRRRHGPGGQALRLQMQTVSQVRWQTPRRHMFEHHSVSVWCAPRTARSTSVGALLVRAVGDRLPISDPASHAAIRRRELLEETRTLVASATVCSRGGKGLRGGCPQISALLEMPSSASRYSVLLL